MNIETVDKMVSDSQQAYQGKDYHKSLWCLDKALEVATHSLAIKTSRAECLAFLGRYTEASEAANSVLQFDNLNADAIYVRGGRLLALYLMVLPVRYLTQFGTGRFCFCFLAKMSFLRSSLWAPISSAVDNRKSD